MKKTLFLIISLLTLCCSTNIAAESFSGYKVADEGAWCWFADPRATHYSNEAGTIDMSYIGYIDVHGNIKATQYNWLTGEKSDVLIRSYFQPDDHNNPTFLVLPDERVLIIYSRHTDEAAFYYRVSVNPGDITNLGEEKCIKTSANTTYPSPFIMSDDPDHWYLCWRGISWHPTIARLTLPDANDDVKFDWGPYQMVQSTGARPYAKYYSNGKDKLYVTYTTGHPDNESPNWVYFNVININGGGEPTLEDIKGNTLSTIKNGAFNVSKTSTYKTNYPYTVVDSPSNFRDWVWQIALDDDSNPVIAMVRINSAKSQHEYYYAKWTGSAWRLTDLADGGGKFHSSNIEYCYSGGEALDPQDPKTIYLSIPTSGDNGKIYEIWKYTLNNSGTITSKEQVTKNSLKNNVRPFMLPDSKDSKLRLCWMNGDYYYWIVRKGYPLGYPTSIMCDYDWQAPEKPSEMSNLSFTYSTNLTMDASNYGGTLLELSNGITYALDASTKYPYVTINGTRYNSECILYTSDNWATQSSGTGGDNWPTMLTTWNLTITYDGAKLITYRNGLIDQVIPTTDITAIPTDEGTQGEWMTQQEVQSLMEETTLQSIVLPSEIITDVVLPSKVNGTSVTWEISNTDIIDQNGTFVAPAEETEITLTASTASSQRVFKVTAMPRDITKNILAYYPFDDNKDASGNGNDLTLMGSAKANGALDLTSNSATAFSTNGYAIVPAAVMDSLRSYTILFEATPKSLTSQPRLYDFGYNSGNSLFCRANTFAAGIKYAGGTTTMVSATSQLTTGTTSKIAVTFDARTQLTCIYINGKLAGSGNANVNEAYMISKDAACTRNYIGRTQWWDTSVANDNGDYVGTIDEMKIFNTALTKKEICAQQNIKEEEKEYASNITNGDVEGTYAAMEGSGVSSDRAIYVPKGWTVEYLARNNNDFTALKSGDEYYDQFFSGKPQNSKGGTQTLWIRQRWGSSNIGFYQEIVPAAGSYTLSADIFCSDVANKSYVYVDGTQKYVSAANTWQTVTFDIESDGKTPIKIGLATLHPDGDNERICAFDNFVLAGADGIKSITKVAKEADDAIYDLSGRRANANQHGIMIKGGKKILK